MPLFRPRPTQKAGDRISDSSKINGAKKKAVPDMLRALDALHFVLELNSYQVLTAGSGGCVFGGQGGGFYQRRTA